MLTAEMVPQLTQSWGGGEHNSPALPEKKSMVRRCVPYFLFTLCASLYLLPFMRLFLQDTDEGTLVEGALRVVHGQLLGRDFFEIIGPGTFYWLALFLKIFGATFLATRICLFVSSLGTAVSIYVLSRRLCRNYQVLPCILVFATYFGGAWPTISHHLDSNCSALLALVCMLLWNDSGKRWLLIAAGLLVGATILTLQPKGLLLLLAFAVWLAIKHRREGTPLTALFWLAGTSLGTVALMLGYFWSHGALRDLIYANVLWPSRNYQGVNSVHYASGMLKNFHQWIVPGHGFNWTIGMAIVLIIPFLFVAALPALVPLVGLRDQLETMKTDISLYWIAGCALWLSELHRKDICHLVFGSPLLMILCIFYMQKKQQKGFVMALQLLSVVSVCLAGCTLALALIARPTKTRAGQISITRPDPALTAIEKHVPSGGELFVYPYPPMYYFLSNTSNPTRYSILLYSYNTSTQFDEVIRTLEEHKVKHVLWDRDLDERVIRTLPSNTRPKYLIMEPYLTSHYRPVWVEDGILLMERTNDDHSN